MKYVKDKDRTTLGITKSNFAALNLNVLESTKTMKPFKLINLPGKFWERKKHSNLFSERQKSLNQQLSRTTFSRKKWHRWQFGQEKSLILQLSIILINGEIIKPDCVVKIDLYSFFSCSYAISFHATVHLPYLFLCLLSKLQAAKPEFCDKFPMGHWKKVSIFLLSWVALLLSDLRKNTRSTITKQKESKSVFRQRNSHPFLKGESKN